jgi:hypothetical protein
MKMPPVLRMLTPLGWTMVGGGVLVAALIALDGLGFRWDPLDLTGRRVRAAQTRASVATADAAARRLEVEAAAVQARRIDEVHQQTVAIAQTTAWVTAGARSAEDAELPLAPDRATRLVEHDRELCRLAPAVCGAAAPVAAGRGGEVLRAGAPAPDAEPG